MVNFGAAEVLVVALVMLPALALLGIVAWGIVAVTGQHRRLRELESRVRALERREAPRG